MSWFARVFLLHGFGVDSLESLFSHGPIEGSADLI
jgi:hypothetical protein